MKLLFIVGGDSLGGIERFIANALPLLREKGYTISLVTILSRGGFYHAHYADHATAIYGPFADTSPLSLTRQLTKIIRTEAPTLVQSFYYWRIPEQAIACLLCRRPLFVSYRSVIKGSPFKAKLLTALTSWMIRGYSAISTSVSDHLLSHFRVPIKKIHLTGNGVDLTRIAFRGKRQPDHHRILIGTVGRLEAVKDHGKIIALADYCRSMNVDWKFTWVGDGSLRSRYEAEIKDLGLDDRITLQGIRDIYQHPVYNTFDFFILTSRHEGFGQVIIEAMASGVPVVAADVAGINTIVTHGVNGLLCAQDDIVGYYNNIRALVDNQDLRSSIVEHGLITAKKYDARQVVDRFIEMWYS